MFFDIIFIMILTFIVQYLIMSMITTNSYSDITNSLNKIYLSTILSLFVGLIYVLFVDFKKSSASNSAYSLDYYIGFTIILGALIYAYRNQLCVTNNDWTNTMIETQSNGIFVSKFVSDNKSCQNTFYKNTENKIPYDLNKNTYIEFSKYIVNTQSDEIELLKKLSLNYN